MRIRLHLLVFAFVVILHGATPNNLAAQLIDESVLTNLAFRGLGPALTSGRVVDIALDPRDRGTWYVAAASGGVWKTVNAGTTWLPVFDDHNVYSIGVVVVDPHNPAVVWIGTGENNSQRSVGWGNGVYKSVDGGNTWKHVGLSRSEHIGKIVVDPRNADIVWVAAQGPLWAPGGERGLYRTNNGGASWTRVLFVSENTGVSDIVLDTRDPDVVYAASYQRRRHVGQLIAGGPESNVYKSINGGESWTVINEGFPKVDRGRIGIAISPFDSDVLYATVPAAAESGGFYRSGNGGESWNRMSDYVPTDPQYYQELFPDPHQFDRVYSVDVRLQVTDDGGANFRNLDGPVHADFHEVAFDPIDPDYLIVGNDGGVYESWDRGHTWKYVHNLSLGQFYRVEVDSMLPFYNVYAGAQDNGTLVGPSRTTSIHGIRNRDWIKIYGGDGFQTRIDYDDPNTVYAMLQYGVLVRRNMRSSENIGIKPSNEDIGDSLRWNWDAPLLLSHFDPHRLYFAANRVMRSEDRGDTWTPISPDLTRGLDRDTMPVMGRLWDDDAVWKNVFTSPLSTIVSMDESPFVEGLIYVGTDDGLIQITEDGGASWSAVDSFPGVPSLPYVSDIYASRANSNAVYATLNRHKRGDFRPYVIKSDDRGRTWMRIDRGLPPNNTAWSIVEDPEQPNLLFLGTEFGVFTSVDAGRHWTQLRSGIPPIPARDLVIQSQHDDLVVASFGRGVYILDDISPLRMLNETMLAREGVLFPVRDAWSYTLSQDLGGGTRGSQGDEIFVAPNPPYGAIFTYLLSAQATATNPRDGAPDTSKVVLTVTDETGEEVAQLTGIDQRGFHRLVWDLRLPPPPPQDDETENRSRLGSPAAPGRYTATLFRRVGDQMVEIGDTQSFEIKRLEDR